MSLKNSKNVSRVTKSLYFKSESSIFHDETINRLNMKFLRQNFLNKDAILTKIGLFEYYSLVFLNSRSSREENIQHA